MRTVVIKLPHVKVQWPGWSPGALEAVSRLVHRVESKDTVSLECEIMLHTTIK